MTSNVVFSQSTNAIPAVQMSLIFILILSLFSAINGLENCLQPANCNILCTYGYLRDVNQKCTCKCAEDPCQDQSCRTDEVCIFTGIRAYCVPKANEQRPECPRLSGGVCALRCERDTDCQGRLICCSNGCGRECVVPKQTFAIKAQTITGSSQNADPLNRIISVVRSLPERINAIMPYPVPVRPEGEGAQIPTIPDKQKIGQCPNMLTDTPCKEPVSECKTDSECSGFQKCCVGTCGNRCLEPIKTSACIHMALAVLRLPERHLENGYVPSCEENGKFSAIQCHESECWCVDVNFGSEIPGTRESLGMKRPDMCLDHRRCLRMCDFSHCPHGLMLDESGCPVDGCLCKEICHGVKCTNSGDSCQLVEPDCGNPPCLPVPRCLINACPIGQPMALATGVTALCAHDEQCSEGFWCHQVGYNGLGFCCIGTKPNHKDETCPSRQPLKSSSCVSTCKIDDECPKGKCCFDGCGLSCLSMKFKPLPSPIRPLHRLKSRYQPGEITRHNKDLLSSLVADCPDLQPSKNCSMDCRSDGDCSGMKRCCRAGCGSRCVHFSKTTPCFHHALTADVYSLRTTFKCDIAGNFERKQCDDNHCFCVDIFSGDEIPGTRTEALEPKCDVVYKCDPVDCQISCIYGFERDSNGCPTCRCKNPCAEVKCPQGSVCAMTTVDCFQKENCPQQPRCVLNLCPAGEAVISPIGVVETCQKNSECPKEHWCHNAGISSGGMCCPSPTRPIRDGECPAVSPQLESYGECKLECRADDDCPFQRKCCFDGCGTVCIEVNAPSKVVEIEVKATVEKPGNCPFFDVRQCGFRERNNECSTDTQCIGVQKCCSDGCRRVCVYPDRNSACLLLKGAYQQIGLMNFVKCRPDGTFDDIQCNAQYCWCVDPSGVEAEGTRTSEDISPTCTGARRCQVPLCVQAMDCKFGFKKDSNGCNTCECHSPCEGVTCPNSAVCVPMPAECEEPPCIEVPRCVINPCAIGNPHLDPSTFDPLLCKDSNQCVGTKSASYCQVFSPDMGYCCPGPEPRSHPGSCPQMTQPTGDCSRHCVLDEQCSSGEKCCSNGCGLSCQPAEFATSVHSNVRIGHCLAVASVGAFCAQRQKVSDCENDSTCPTHMKCCFDGCAKKCSAPAVTTQCIHARLAALTLRADNPAVFVPECDSNGEYQQVQQHYGLRWCVDISGDEIPGTKTTKQPNCRYPRSCPVHSCNKNCPFGFKTNNDGCIVCDCRSPCELVDCQAGSVCRVVAHRCLTENCHPVARCVPNTCPSGEPLVLQEHQMMAECDSEIPCPAGYFCKSSGYLGKGFCCKGMEHKSLLACTSVPAMNNSVDGSPCVVGCRHQTDCPQAICCFNGCGTSCQFEFHQPISPVPSLSRIPILSKSNPIKSVVIGSQVNLSPEGAANQVIRPVPVTTVIPISVSMKTVTIKVGICPATLLNPGCKEECLADSDCPGFFKCCKASCAARCVPPETTTSCIHKLLFYYKESPAIPPPVQCNDDGTYRQHQCDIRTRQCWCADRNNGKELIGTRRSSEEPLIDCSKPIACSTSCTEVEPLCPFGVKLDATGCPLSGICGCKNPCEDVQCSSPLTACTLVKVSCLRLSCPPIPRCMPNLCGLNRIVTDDYGNPKSCSRDADCTNGRCVIENKEEGIGLCCAYAIEPKEPVKQVLVTNCTLLRSAVDRLYNNGAVTSLLKPGCADLTGYFTSVQCNPSGTCWCADPYSGIEIPGTREVNAKGRNVCAAQRICSSACSHTSCPFGLILDRFGCPRSDCKCSSPCDNVSCTKGKVCLLRAPVCPTHDCSSVPVCESSPCENGDHPAIDSITRRHFGCIPGNTACPDGYSCTVRDDEGFCCPSNEPFQAPPKSKAKEIKETMVRMNSCPHGDPFAGTSDGTPYACTATGNGCPSTHYCVTDAGKKKGICCVSKRYVCNLKGERGPCSLSVPRYYYSSFNKSCIPFHYGGCAGNLNNFATLDDCNDFCEGVGVDFTVPLMDDVDMPSETLQLGFSLTGPLLERSQESSVQRSLIETLSRQYKIPESALSDLYVRKDNNVRFTITHPDAREFSRPLSEAVTSGKLAFDIDDVTYHVEPHTWYAELMQPTAQMSSGKKALYIAIAAAAVLAALIVFCVCFACYLYCSSASKENDSLRGSTPSNFVSHSIVAHRRPQPNQRREIIFSREDLHEEEHYRRVEPHNRSRSNPSFRSERPQSSFYF